MTNLDILVFCDGGARGNPGKGASAFVVYKGKNILHKEGHYLGVTTNNKAEYWGVINALSWLLNNYKDDWGDIIFFLDSELVVKQINGLYKIKNNDLKELNAKLLDLKEKIKNKICFKHVRREKNKIADSLVNKVLDENI